MTAAAPVARRRDAVRSREQLLGAAGALFAEHGYDRTTLREIGERAGVDAALVARYFGSKTGLYLACLHAELGEQPPDDLLAPGRVPALLARVDARGPGPVFQAAVRSHEDAQVQQAARAELDARLVAPLRDRLLAERVEDADLLAETAVAAFTGVALGRSAGSFGALSAAEPDQVAALVGRLLAGLLAPATEAAGRVPVQAEDPPPPGALP